MDVSKTKNGLILPQFPGVTEPTTDFEAVRAGLIARPRYKDIDLSIARSITGTGVNAAFLVQLPGNSFFVDQFLSAGFATVYFQDTNLSASGAPIYVGPGFIGRVPFTQLLFENVAQPGKILRFIFGTDIDFVPGFSQQISSIGAIASTVTVQDNGFTYASVQKSIAVLVAAATEQVFAAASNPNGAIIYDASCDTNPLAVGFVSISLHAHTVVPAAFTDGDVLMQNLVNASTLVGITTGSRVINRARHIPSGKGLWWLNTGSVNEGVARRSVLYTLL